MRARRPLAALTVTVALAGGVNGCSNGDGSDSVATAPTSPVRSTTTAAPTTTAVPDTPVVALDTIEVRTTVVASVLAPTAMTQRPGSDTFFVAERAGTIRTARADGERLVVGERPALDLTSEVADLDGERGLLGLAFTPDGDHLVVSYTDGNDDGASVLARYDVDDRDGIDVRSRIEVLRLPQPYANHNGGDVVTGPDGYLYVGFGDGGSQGDPDDRAQDLGDLLGKILRIDVSASTADRPYTVPADGPFVGTEGARNEIWIVGTRNPWRFSFDPATGDLWIGDVGGAEWEEVDHLPAAPGGAGRGANLGWSLREGAHDTDKAGPRPDDLVDPVFEYSHDEGASITGGLVYRGTAIAGLAGAYLFSDFAAATLRAVRPVPGDPAAPVEAATLRTTGDGLSQPVAFAAGRDGEVYVLGLTGEIVRLEAA